MSLRWHTSFVVACMGEPEKKVDVISQIGYNGTE